MPVGTPTVSTSLTKATVTEAIRTLLLADAAVAALLSTRIYPGSAPERPTFPLVVLDRSGTTFHHNMDGPSTLRQVSQNVAIYSDDYDETQAVGAAIAAVLDAYTGTVWVGIKSLVVDSIFAVDETEDVLNTEDGAGRSGQLYARTLEYRVNYYVE